MLDENVLPAANQPGSQAVGQPLVTLVTQQPVLDNPTNCVQTSGTPGLQLETAQRQHPALSKNLSGKAVTLHTILLGVGAIRYTEHPLKQNKKTAQALKCTHPQPLHLIETNFALKCSRCYKLPEQMLRFV
eukprot:776922-Pelagomonas_calceolata.AAC.1